MPTGYGYEPYGAGTYGGGPPGEPPYARSVFTDKGPIAKPPLTLLQGSTATFVSYDTVQVSGGQFSASLVGQYLNLTGSGKHDGDYLILGVPSSNRLKLRASFSLPDTPATSWRVYDARTGQIADQPSHVTVRVNGTPVAPDAVYGLLGQIVMPSPLASGDHVEVDYSWVRNPTVDVTRLNSREFKFNGWNHDIGRPNAGTNHTYRYNNVLLEPSSYRASRTIQQGTGVTVTAPDTVTLTSASLLSGFVGLTLALQGTTGTTYRQVGAILSTTSLQVTLAGLVGPYTSWTLLDLDNVVPAALEQPTQRELHYRAYERAYTAIFNDPNLLVFNTPTHRIAYPPLERTVTSQFISYSPTGLPENDIYYPWERIGSGSTTLTASNLVVQKTSAGVFPNGNPLFWRRRLDQTFPHAFALAWSIESATATLYQGVWSGLAAGYSTDLRAMLVGFVEVGGIKKVGFLRKDYADTPDDAAAWTGGIDTNGDATNAPATLDWSLPRSYRIFRGRDGIVRLYIDGEVVEILKVHEDDLPFLEDVPAPFNEVQQVFWGSLGRAATNTSAWNFVRYQVLPTNPLQTAPSVFVSYEGNDHPEEAAFPWTPVGYHGTETILSSQFVLIGSTSATDAATVEKAGLVGGDFRGLMRIEPLLEVSSDVILDVSVQGYTYTHGVAPNAVMVAIDDGTRLTQLSFLTSKAAPILGYGGRSFPTEWAPTPWSQMGTASSQMVGRVLRITDTQATSGLVYYVDDVAPFTSDERVIGASNDYMVEFRCHVHSYTADGVGFCGVSADAYDGQRTLGVLLRVNGGVREVAFHSDGTVLAGYPFEWGDGEPHIYRVAKIGGNVTLFADQGLLGILPYTAFAAPSGGGLTGVLSFGSAVPSSNQAVSTTDWHYVNAWRLWSDQKFYVGLWRGQDSDSLIGYHLPLKASYRNVTVQGSTVTLPTLPPPSLVAGDDLIIDDGPNKGVYGILSVASNALSLDRVVALQPSTVSFRVPLQTDWRTAHNYKIARTPAGAVTVIQDADPEPFISVGYNNVDLPDSAVGIPRQLAGGLPSICWGAFDPTRLSSSAWDYVRYGITRSPNELRIVPHHQNMNQRNVMASPEHLRTNIPHPHTNFWSSSTGIPPQGTDDVFRNPALEAYTKLNEDTPLYPRTQTSEVRVPTPYRRFLSAFNRAEDVMNVDGDFKFNDGTSVWRLLVPDDVLYNSLEVIEQTTGQPNKIAPFTDQDSFHHYSFEWQKEVCLSYDGTTLPEDAANQPTPWTMASDDAAHVTRQATYLHLNYGTDATGTRTIYRNNTPLTDSPSLSTRVSFRIRVEQDGTYGLGDSQIRLGFSAIGMTVALAFKTLPSGERYVAVVDLNAQRVLAGIPFDFLDGAYHTYQIVRNPSHNTVTVTVVS